MPELSESLVIPLPFLSSPCPKFVPVINISEKVRRLRPTSSPQQTLANPGLNISRRVKRPSFTPVRFGWSNFYLFSIYSSTMLWPVSNNGAWCNLAASALPQRCRDHKSKIEPLSATFSIPTARHTQLPSC